MGTEVEILFGRIVHTLQQKCMKGDLPLHQ